MGKYDAGSQHGESCPWQRSWGRGPGKKQRLRSGLRGTPGFSWASTPKTRVCLLYCVMLSTYSSDINRGLSPHYLFLEKVNLELLDNKSPGHNKSVSIQNPLWWLSSLPAGLLQLRMWLFEASPTAGGTGSLKHPRNVGASEESKSFRIGLIKGFICWANTCCQVFISFICWYSWYVEKIGSNPGISNIRSLSLCYNPLHLCSTGI